MKTKLLLLLLSLLGANAFAQYTTIPDAKFEAKLITLGIDDVPDGKVLTSKINTLNELSISSSSITDLTGIQDFTALSNLSCGSNQLTSLDLSKNTALTSLNCYGNQLTSLNLSNNIALQYLYCYSNRITSLDVSKNIALNSLNCRDNAIKNLDLSKNAALTSLDCVANLLTYLNIKNGKNTSLSKYSLYLGGNGALSCITVDDASYSNLNWNSNKDFTAIYSSYDCTSIIQIPDTKFEEKLIVLGIDTDGKNGLVLNSSIATITSLNLSNSSITDLDGLEGFTALKTLICSNNSLPRINISKNPALTSLDCSGNTTLTCIQVADINTAKANITTTQDAKDKFNLDCRPYTLIPDSRFEAKLISLGYDSVADGKVETKKINRVKSLSISNAGLTDLTGIQDFSALTSLNCGYNQLTSLDISKNTSLTSLSCYSNKITNIDISKNTSLTSFSCDNNKITSIDISKNVTLTSISCYSNLLTSLNTNNNIALNSLNCSSNKITSLDLSKNTALKSISCSSNELTSLNIKNGINKQIGTMSFNDNPLLTCVIVDDVEYAKDKWTTQSNTPKKTFSPFECSTITPIPDAKFEDKLIALGIDTDGKNNVVFNSSISNITTLDISNSVITDATGLKGFTALKTLNCANNSLDRIDISKNTALTSLNCSNNATLKCIQVADINAAKTNITTTQEAKDKFNLDCNSYTLIPDSNFEKTLISLGYDTVADGKVLTKSINTIKSLELPWYNSIKDITGIQDFTSLTSLDIYSVDISTLDVSKNINLTTLDCSSIGLTSLDLSKNTKLTTLDCNSNKLTSLDLSNNIALETVNCNVNQLTSLNVSKNTALKKLYCSSNLLTAIDVSNNLALNSLGCDTNKITSIDVSKNKQLNNLTCNGNKLTYLNLKNQNTSFNYLNCTGNLNLNCITVNDVAVANSKWTSSKDSHAYFTDQDCATITIIPDVFFEDKLIALTIDKDGKNGYVVNSSIETVTSLDISNSSITNLTGLEGFKALTNLNCSKNSLRNLDLTKNTAIKTLNCSNNATLTCIQVSDVDKAAKNWTVTKDATASFSLDCRVYTLIPDTNFEAKLISLGYDNVADGKVETDKIDKIPLINLYNASITNLKGIEDFKALTILNCSYNNLSSLDISKNTSIKELYCSSNDLTSLDVSKNIALTYLDCSWNDLTSLNIKNGKNAFFTTLYMNVNNDLNCITVDDVAYANTNWSSKKNSTAIFTTYDCNAYTIINDSNFENKLIALGIDTDGKNGMVANSGIEKLTQLNISNSSIINLKGIEGFKALTTLNCSNNALTQLDLNKNTTLTKIECQSNQITDLEIEKCISLTHLNVSSNKLDDNFDSYYLKALAWLSVSNNEITSLNLYQNSELETLLCNNNKLTSISTSQVDKLKEINCSNNQITYLDISNLANLVSLNVSANKIGNIDFSNNIALTSLDISGNTFAKLVLSKNKVLSKLNCSTNKIQELNLSQNKSLTDINCSANQLTLLNLRNGNNTKFNTTTFDLKNNANLSCIKVDNKSYADTNWSDKKDTSASFETQCGLNIPANNFTVQTRSESCVNEKNGEINIYANESYAYNASINGKSAAFVDNSLNITNLAPGNYTVIITIPDEDFEQKYTITIEKATKVSGKSSISSKKVDVEIKEGTAPYTVFVDGVEQFETNETNFSVSAKEGLLEVKTAKSCEGIYRKDIADLNVIVSAFPNPTTGNFNINISGKKEEVFIEISSLDGRIISNKKYILENGTARLTLDNETKGVYIAKIYLDTIKTIKIIKI